MAKKRPTKQQMINAARRMYNEDGKVEVDGNARISWGDDPGAYVQAWVWVYFDQVQEIDK